MGCSDELKAAQTEIRRLQAVVAAYRLLVVGKDGLLVAYRGRTGRIPADALDTIRRVEEILKGLGTPSYMKNRLSSEILEAIKATLASLPPDGTWSFTYVKQRNQVLFQHWRSDGYVISIEILVDLLFDSPEVAVNLLVLQSCQAVEIDQGKKLD